MKTVLTIAGSDSCGGAGIQADIKAITAHGCYAMSAVCALTAQNTSGVADVIAVEPDFLKKQLDCIFTDIFPDAVKIGMVPTKELMAVIRERLVFYGAKNIVVDPVMIATSGSRLVDPELSDTLGKCLFPISTLVTPNIFEGEVLTKTDIKDKNDMAIVARKIGCDFKCNVLLKGGHSPNDADDLLWINGEKMWLKSKRIDSPNTHGTGCTLSSSIASNLAKGEKIYEAVKNSKRYINGALSSGLQLGRGTGPINHLFDLKSEFI